MGLSQKNTTLHNRLPFECPTMHAQLLTLQGAFFLSQLTDAPLKTNSKLCSVTVYFTVSLLHGELPTKKHSCHSHSLSLQVLSALASSLLNPFAFNGFAAKQERTELSLLNTCSASVKCDQSAPSFHHLSSLSL